MIPFLYVLGSQTYTLWICWIIILAVLNAQCGVRKLWVKFLLYVFERCREKIELTEKERWPVEEEDDNEKETVGLLTEEESGHVIDRELVMRAFTVKMANIRTLEELRHDFQLSDITYFCKSGMEAIIQDECTQRFQAEELTSWNLLTRTEIMPEFISPKMTALWCVGFIVRYIILLPFRLSLFFVSLFLLIMGNAFIGFGLPKGKIRRWAYSALNKACSRILTRAFSAVITFHNRENRAKGGGICVANHTSPLDTFILGCDNTYAMVGQVQGGLFGAVQRALARAESHVWFQRAEVSDRQAVGRRLREHVEDKSKLPILIFPEGTCINNTSIMMFKKGSFETGGVIYPAAIKYDPRFADMFWNSSKCGIIWYLLMIMTSWACVCEIWYLPPQTKREDETAVQFANRVKSYIAQQGGLVDLDWDGGLKRSKPSQRLLERAQADYSSTIILNKED